MKLRREQRTPVYKNVMAQIRKLIKEGKLAPGDQLLPERQLAETLGVSRPAVREALTALATMGLIEIRPGGGAYVREVNLDSLVEPLATVMFTDQESVFHLVEAREVLECQIVRLACQRATERDLHRIRENAFRAERDMPSGKADSSDTAFHVGLSEATHNPLLISMMAMLSGLMREAYGPCRAQLLADREMVDRYNQQHFRIYDAICRRDPEAAEAAVREHLGTVKRELQELPDTQAQREEPADGA
ncbi:hypothetical protein SY88_08110 [Clostridiales bacterium PH28_bin88]|nr:hypothetical protein SY88_08110 [Clostridiales bacterium PH28_bin88]